MCASQERHATVQATFGQRATKTSHPLASYLLRLMELKQSNLCLSADVPNARELLSLADAIGPSIVIFKTHYDLVAGWDYHPKTGTGAKLGALARKHGFLIFEDRKFGDIGHTVQLQYTAGTARIIDWAHIVNINMIPGKPAVKALAEAAKHWRSRVNYEVNTSVTVGTPVSDSFNDNGDEEDEEADTVGAMHSLPSSTQLHDSNSVGRKGSIVSITTLTQSFEPVDSPRFSSTIAEGDEMVYAGIEEPPWERGLLILAQMSSSGNYMTPEYTRACQEAARENKDFVIGFISQGTLNTEPDDNFISMTPGVQLPPEGSEEEAVAGDGLGQQYNTPSMLVGDAGSDIIIVGRGILKAGAPRAEAERYRRRAWCDRKLPCTNCQSRNKESSCRYETGTPVAKIATKTTSSSSNEPLEQSDAKPTADFGYSANAGSTLGFLRKIENAAGAPLAGMPTEAPSEESFDMRERYKSLIRQLPARTYVERLVDIYFHDVNWQYFGIDEPLTRNLMDKWYSLPFNVLSGSGPLALDPMLRALPALLFQMVSCALLYLPPDIEKDFECLKYTANMTFDDLSIEYSEAGMAIVTLLGKRQMSIITVLAGWCRASLLKFCGMVTEAWHQVGTSIRDAQGIGLHRDQMDPQPTPDDTGEEAMEKMWRAHHRRMVWLILMSWDLHTGAVLGRPTSIDHRLISRSYPIDAIVPRTAKRVPLVPRTDDDPPTPLTRMLWSWQIMKTLREIQDLEKEGPFPKDFSKVEKIQTEILEIKSRTPAPFRSENPDIRFDQLPECWWLPYARAQLPQLHAFNILALHRPYVFTRSASRNAALEASLEMLESQRQQFAALNTTQHRTYSLFFGTFDAVVMVASIYILFPRENPELLDQARQHFQWAVDRFEKMGERNHLARSALGVLKAIWIRFKKAVGHGFLTCHCTEMAKAETEAASRWLASLSEGHSSASSTHRTSQDTSTTSVLSCSAQPTPPTDLTTPISAGAAGPTPPSIPSDHGALLSPEWTLPTDFDFGSIMPMYPMGDIAYNDLTGVLGASVGGGGTSAVPPELWATTAAAESSAESANNNAEPSTAINGLGMPGLHTMLASQEQFPWQFGGEFGTDTIWNVLNQFPS
ncbi:Orotidine 5'-phosphate decarboxylase [Xylaria sp. FL1777]|nr:Orotidine 5'-phosphate decarboxylase [Xylaria sp. FL1777]